MRKISSIFIICILLLFAIAVGCKEQAGQAGKQLAIKDTSLSTSKVKCGPNTITCDYTTNVETTTIYNLQSKNCRTSNSTRTCPNGCNLNTSRCA